MPCNGDDPDNIGDDDVRGMSLIIGTSGGRQDLNNDGRTVGRVFVDDSLNYK